MMNWIIGAVIAAVVVIGGGYVLMSGGYSMEEGGVTIATGDVTGDGAEDAAKEMDKSTPKLMEKASAFTGSFFDLASRGGNYACDISSTGTNNATKGTVYVSGTNVRGDFTSSVGGSMVESHMLKLGGTVYVWGGGMEQGIMMKATAMEGQGSAATQGQGVSGTQEYGWNCRATGTEASMFVKPNLEFMDIDAMMQGMGSIPGAR